ncbi:MAG: hypothetical protein AAFN78_11985 [Pseudomonadota bacterium]
MQNRAAVKSLSVAMSGSIAAHVLVALAIVWYLGTNLEPSITQRLLVLNVQASLPADEDPTEDSDVEPTDVRETGGPAQTAQSDAPVAQEATAPEAIVETPTLPMQATAAIEAPATSTRDEQLPVDEPTEVEQAANTTIDVAMATELVVATQSEVTAPADNPNLEPVALSQVAVSPTQEKMLQHKFTQWAEDFHDFDAEQTSVTWKKKGQEYVARFRRLPAQDDMGIERVEVEISTEQQGVRLSTQMVMKKLAFSNYGQFVHRWDPSVQIHDDELDGRFHSNSKINISYDRAVNPVFFGKVTTASRAVNYTESRGFRSKNTIFQGGLQTGVKRIRMPDRYLPFPDATPDKGALTRHFEEATRIEFFSDGTFSWCPVEDVNGEGVHRERLSDKSTYLIGARGKPLHISGVVNGKVLIYSPSRIVIEDDLVYAHRPGARLGADDYLGLVSDKDVHIAGPDITGPGDLNVHGAIYARRRFVVKRYMAREHGLLSIYGSLTAGSLSATEPRYNTRIRFDERLENLRPPGFPTTNRFEVEDWDGAWVEED